MPRDEEAQKRILDDDSVRRVSIELRDPYGGVIAGPWIVEEEHEGFGGAYTFGAYLDAHDVLEVRAPFAVPGVDPRALFYFCITLDPDTRVQVHDA